MNIILVTTTRKFGEPIVHKVKYLSLLACVLSLLSSYPVFAIELEISRVKAIPGQTVSVDVAVNGYNQEAIAGTVFTLSYNTTYLTLENIESDHFTSFLNQWALLDPVPEPLPADSVSISGTTYSRPLVYNFTASGVMIAATRVKAAQPAVLMTFVFTVNNEPGVTDAPLPISIQPSVISNMGAGYPASGEAIPILYDFIENETEPSQAYPSYSPAIVNGYIDTTETFNDADGDGIEDDWEILHFGNTDTADELTDYDNDFYTDLQEFLNFQANEKDPKGAYYTPLEKNAPQGTGYNNMKASSGFWQLMLPVILQGGGTSDN